MQEERIDRGGILCCLGSRYMWWLTDVFIWGGGLILPVIVFWYLKTAPHAWGFVCAILIMIAWGMLLYVAVWVPRQIVVHTFSLSGMTLPAARYIVVSDIHVGPYKKQGFVQRVVDTINAQRDIDGVLWIGDFLYGSPHEYMHYLKPLQDIRFPQYAVLGNHDYGEKIQPNSQYAKLLTAGLSEWGITVLRNEHITLPNGTILGGVDDDYRGFHDLSETFVGVADRTPRILLSHTPDIVDEILSENLPELTICGHTHGGQIRLPFLGAVPGTIPTRNGKKYERHLYELTDRSWLFVSSGLGEVLSRVRAGAKPEVVIVEVE